jgi:sortase A
VWKAIGVLGRTLVWSGLLVLAFLVYQLFVTDLVAESSQAEAKHELTSQLADRRQALPTPQVVEEPSPQPTSDPIQFHVEQQPEDGTPFAEIEIPKIELDAVVFSGVDRSTLKLGPGHMPWTPLPGQPGNAVISGHRTTYGRPFYRLDELVIGDRIEVETAIGRHVYEVRHMEVVKPTDVWVTDPRPGAWLTLTTCNPRFSARERLVVFSELVEGPNLRYADLLLQNEVKG